jgi:hypothetical protein
MIYQCSKCGLAVIVTPEGTIIRACTCNAPIVANLSAGLAGKGGTKVK